MATARSKSASKVRARRKAPGLPAEGEYIVSLHAGYETNGVYTDAFLARPADGAVRAGVVAMAAPMASVAAASEMICVFIG